MRTKCNVRPDDTVTHWWLDGWHTGVCLSVCPPARGTQWATTTINVTHALYGVFAFMVVMSVNGDTFRNLWTCCPRSTQIPAQLGLRRRRRRVVLVWRAMICSDPHWRAVTECYFLYVFQFNWLICFLADWLVGQSTVVAEQCFVVLICFTNYREEWCCSCCC